MAFTPPIILKSFSRFIEKMTLELQTVLAVEGVNLLTPSVPN